MDETLATPKTNTGDAAEKPANVPEGNSDQRLHYLRTSNPANPEILAVYPQRIGTNRPNAYTFPLSFLSLPTGLPVFEGRQCGRLDPPIITVDQIAQIVGGATTLPDLGPVSDLLPPGLTPIQLQNVLPDDLRAFMSNVAVLVEDEPPAGLPLLGLYQGVPLTQRTSGYAAVPPDKITIYRGPLERLTGGDPDRLREQVRRVVLHEIAHHFGISDERLRELDRY